MMNKYTMKFLIFVSLAFVISGACSAFAAKIGNQPMTTVDDVVAATGVNPALKKDSLLYVLHDKSSGNVEFRYVRFGDKYALETEKYGKTIFKTQTSDKNHKISGLYPAVSKNYTNSTLPPAVVMAGPLTEGSSTYNLNLYQVSKSGNTVSVTEKNPVKTGNTYVAYGAGADKDISALKGGIFANGSTREIFAALQWNEAINGSNFVNLDFFSVAQGGTDMKWEKTQTIAASPSLSLGNSASKMAVGDFNGDGYANEIAVVTNIPDQWKYYLYVYQVNWKGAALEVTTLVNAREVYSHAVDRSYDGNTRRDIWFLKAACDVAMADFNGDGRNEIAVIYKGYNEDLPSDLDSALPNTMGPVYVKLYQYSATRNDRLIESKSTGKKSFSSLGSWNRDKRKISDIGDLKAVAADVDGDGKSELAMLGISWESEFEKNTWTRNTMTMGEWSTHLHLWRYDAPSSGTAITDIPATLNMKYDKKIADLGKIYSSTKKIRVAYLNADTDNNVGGYRAWVEKKTFTESACQIISGVFSGTSTTQKPCEDIIVNFARGSVRLEAFCPVLDNDGKFKEFKQISIANFTYGSYTTVGLAAGDFVGDGVLLKNPYHFYHEGRSILTSVIQALPYHVDYIPLPWEKNGKPKLANFTYVPGGEVAYVRTTETKDKNTVKTVSSSTYEMKTKLGASISYSPTDLIPFVPDPNDKFSPRQSFLFEGRANYTGKDTTQKLEASTETVKTTETVKSSAVDSVMAYSVRHHTWRYPIDPVPEWYKSRSKDIPADGKFAYTVTMTEAPKAHKGRIGYNARHEEGNLFSYPTKIENINDFTNAKTKVLTEAVDYLLEPGEYKKEVEITASKETENNITAEYTWQAGFNFQYMFGNYGIGKSGVKVDTDHQWSWNGLRNNVLNSTFTKGDKLSVSFADPSKASAMAGLVNNVAFLTTYQAYINPSGLMKMGFAVNLQGGGSPTPLLWRESVYNVSADPSFVLPNKFVIKDKTVAVNPDKLSATSVRGVELYAMYEGKQLILPAPFFAKGSTYVLSFPIYNASFVDAPSFKVKLSYAPYKYRNDTSKFTKIDEVTISTLKGWTQGSEANKTYANFTFTVPSDSAFGDHVFLAEIDPENAIKEVHEEWSEKIPGGNNTGIFIFPIMDADGQSTSNNSKRIAASDVKATVKVGKKSGVKTSAENEDYVPLEWVDYEAGKNLYDYIMSQSDPVEITVNLDYLADAETGLTLFEIVQEVEEDGESFDEVYDEDTYYVTADADNTIDYSFYFVISSEDIKDARAVRLDITDLDDLTSDDETFAVSIPLIFATSQDKGNNNGSETLSSSGGGCGVMRNYLIFLLLGFMLLSVKFNLPKAG
ncbi:MAG: hypothetical protein SPL10_06970 [Synergistales bacterium]|nr:hypothetical protein [Synergistales bacterium]MDY6400979.1 hypothetical protein [Synergistales bacterium]MDY6404893.1 hypothetical protein [Synergistales bacterium]MDY6411092.1 hypothetical protein [Synergistales bacterium]MDY6414880.1 hypothetical protein [Synergistales bacterium]